jgi:beta-lactamase regulating signal transducer with metallopeptidase domain
MAWWIFQHVVTTALLALIVALVCRMTRIGPVARHALWVLVLIKFVTPPLVAGPWTMPDPLGLSGVEENSSVEGIAQTEASATEPIHIAETASFVSSSAGEEPMATATDDVPAWWWLVGVWMTGSLLLAAVEGIRLFRLARRTRAASPAGSELSARVARHASSMGLAPVSIVLVDGARAPSVWGLIRPRILWPATLGADVPEIGTDGLIVHELAHVKRRDHLVGWIELAGGVLWWWNPLFWSVRSALREQAELACDAWVISALPDGRRAYAESLLALCSEGAHSVPSSMAVVGISATTRRSLERRLVMIMKGRTSLRLTSVGICSLVVVAAAALPTWAASPQESQPPAAAPVMVPPASAASPAQPVPQAVAAPRSRPMSVPPTVMQAPTRRPPAAQRPTAAPSEPPVFAGTYLGRGRANTANLPEAARALAEAFEKDQQAYQEEMMRNTAARRQRFNAEMQGLQDELTKAGKLDEAVAVRDYLRAGTPTSIFRPTSVGRGGRGAAAAPVAARGRSGGGGR